LGPPVPLALEKPGLTDWLPILAVIFLANDGAFVFLLWRIRITLRRSAALSSLLPDLTEYEKVVLAKSIRTAINREVFLYEHPPGSG
jgi:hypothetical protein